MNFWSQYITHFTRDHSDVFPPRTANDNFVNILLDSSIHGGTGMIKGQHKCICFTETPIDDVAAYKGLLDNFGRAKYSRLGFAFKKQDVFSWGGRPVIYQPVDEYDNLNPANDWRHVTYHPIKGTDWTWEREWRLKSEKLIINPAWTTLIFPDKETQDFLLSWYVHYAIQRGIGYYQYNCIRLDGS